MNDFIPVIIALVFLLVAMGIFKKPKQRRAIALTYLFLISFWLIYLGDRWEINMIKAKYLGYGLCAFGILALFGINIWRGGPLDPKKEHNNDDSNDDSNTH